MVVTLVGTALGCVFFGWVGGMWTRKRTNQWCSVCGHTLKCFNCERVPAVRT